MAGIYIHIPFCKKLCHYCDFYHILSGDDNAQFVNALAKEAEMRKDYTGKESISTIYFGGGTPSVLSGDELTMIFDNLKKHFNIEPESEITMEKKNRHKQNQFRNSVMAQ